MRKSVIDTLIVVVIASVLKADDSISRDCPMTFDFFFEAYRSCAHFVRDRGQQQQVTGGEIIRKFQEICSTRPKIDRCRKTVLEGCSSRHVEIYQSAVDTSLWFCDEDNNIRGAITRALIDTVTVPDREKNKSKCIHDHSKFSSCPNDILNQKRFSRVKNYRNVVEHHSQQVLSDPLVHEYFRALFDCHFDKVYVSCPHNAIPMVIDSVNYMFSPPQFGINVSEIILNKANELRTK